MTEKEAGQLLLDYVKWVDDETADPNDCPFDADDVLEAMKMGAKAIFVLYKIS